ncbi:2,4-dienoyl-CoA reductase-like NADH-dependent reductase (Old Yellow Enzyme family) [Jatrophihabitans sp. GAS493]|uniref:NADH:flavin oxidoreductase/NADH oxidase n=1 Tax=Jatrophihabitans sp. GAS493 TaxID=1907575 RepID=UPI000BB68AB6|nr:NADH:flavin oxidoreductase/NADH oxidase [Jatrophihabitans sp. GAS493]SOD72971.1 2,4-dienoyl-CoA reductase-like NADH-dependent reductase (Old Yellow Enzyme family) [Jatrophihabitans sp. GAS493]
MSELFTPYTLRATTFRNRAWVAPMCQYSSVDGHPTDWHLVHLGSLARGGAGLVISEATAVTAQGRISPFDAGIWNDEQAVDYRRITDFIKAQGAVAGIQLAHAGRKASTGRPWQGHGPIPVAEGGWQTVGASALGFGDWPAPRELSTDEVAELPSIFAAAASRSLEAGFEVAELHAAHGYLLHQFLSPLSNRRSDRYGGDFAGRTRALLEITAAVREVWPADNPLFVRLSATDWVEGGWDLEQSIAVSARLADLGVDLIDVSSGGLDPRQRIAPGPGYQVEFAEAIRSKAGIAVAAVGLITAPAQAEQILADGQADAIELARVLLRDPSWPQRAAHELGDSIAWPPQYERGRWPS